MNRRGQSGELILISGFARGRLRRDSFARWQLALAVALFAFACPLAARAASPAEMISSFRHQHGEAKVTTDPALNRIARRSRPVRWPQGDRMDHAVQKPFSRSRRKPQR